MIDFSKIIGFSHSVYSHESTYALLKQEAREWIVDTISDGYDKRYEDLHDYVFNREFYTSYKDEAKKLISAFGAFEAIDKVVEYEKDCFGEVYTDITSPLSLSNMLWYIIGEEVMEDVRDICYQNLESEEDASPNSNALLLSRLKKIPQWENFIDTCELIEPSEEDFFTVCG